MTAPSTSAAEMRAMGGAIGRAALQTRLADIVAVLLATAPSRVGGGHGAPVAAKDQPAQQRRRLAAGTVGAGPCGALGFRYFRRVPLGGPQKANAALSSTL